MELRSDIATAASRMTSEYDVNREVRQLGAYLREGESVQRLATGIYGAGAGLLAVTDHRVLLLRDGRSGQASEGFPLGRLSSADWSADGGRATITVSDSNSTAVLRQVAFDDARGVVELIHQLADAAPGHRAEPGHDLFGATPAGHDGTRGSTGAGPYSGASYGDGSYSGGSYGDGSYGGGSYGGGPYGDGSYSGGSYGGVGAASRASGETGPEIAPAAVFTDRGGPTGAYDAVGAAGSTGGYRATGGYLPAEGSGTYGQAGPSGATGGTYGQSTVPGATGGYQPVDPHRAPVGAYDSATGARGDGSGEGFLPGGRTLNGAGAPGSASLFGGGPDTRAMPDSASATTMTFNRPVGSGPGWTGVQGIPSPTGPGDGAGGVPVSALAGSGAVPLPELGQTSRFVDVPSQQRAVESSGPLGLTAANLVGEVPITQLAAEGSGGFDAVTDADQPYPTGQLGTVSGRGAEGTPVRDLDAGSAATAAVLAGRVKAPGEESRDGFVPDIDATGEAGAVNLTAEGTERPKPITWRPPSGGRVNPLRGPRSRKNSKAEGEPDTAEESADTTQADAKQSPKQTEDFSTAIGLKSGTNRARWIWLTAGAAALVGLAAVGSVKLLGSTGTDGPTPVSPVPAAAVDSPTPSGPVVQVSKVLAGDRVEVTGQYTGTVVVLGIVSPSGTGCGAEQSKQYAVDTLNHQTVTLLADASQPATDSSGRKLAYLELPNNNDYSTQVVGAGMAKYFDSGKPVQYTTQIKAAQSVAEQDKDGLWGPPCNGSFSGAGTSASSKSSADSDEAENSDGQSDSSSSESGSATSSGSSSTKSTTKAKPSHSTGSTTTGHSTTGSTTTSQH